MSASFDYLGNRAAFERTSFRHHSARADCQLRAGILHIDYSGSISQTSFHALDIDVLAQRKKASAALERMDKALTLISVQSAVCEEAWPVWTPPSAVIVREDQYEGAMEFCRRLALRGVIRLAFPPQCSALASRWLGRICLERQGWGAQPGCTR